MTKENTTQAAANKAAEEGGQDVQSLYKAYFRSDDPVPGFSASRQVANKAEVERPYEALSNLLTYRPEIWAGKAEMRPCEDEDGKYVALADVRMLLDHAIKAIGSVRHPVATSPATTGASTVLTDERIATIDTPDFVSLLLAWETDKLGTSDRSKEFYALTTHIDRHVASQLREALNDRSREYERRVRFIQQAAQAGKVTVPGWNTGNESLIEYIARVNSTAPSPAKESK